MINETDLCEADLYEELHCNSVFVGLAIKSGDLTVVGARNGMRYFKESDVEELKDKIGMFILRDDLSEVEFRRSQEL